MGKRVLPIGNRCGEEAVSPGTGHVPQRTAAQPPWDYRRRDTKAQQGAACLWLSYTLESSEVRTVTCAERRVRLVPAWPHGPKNSSTQTC
mmetsp:Transcript_66850/g.118635  ORF Transcript_66850/g.118635 Transcript_66850/m.118635 type:complete len:90 (-) Transcript_66850:901-1170(-)